MDVKTLIGERPELFVRQKKEWVEIFVDWETKNQYEILDSQGQEIGLIVEKAGGFWDHFRRGFLRSHRRLEIGVFDSAGSLVLSLQRPFFFLFSNLSVSDADIRPIGRVQRRFGILYKRYDLLDQLGTRFARISSPRWRLWTFPVANEDGRRTATISKKWGGALQELFADADTFRVEFNSDGWSNDQRAVILAAAISIDFDFFENN
jgi:uncharacterized protein YxjI